MWQKNDIFEFFFAENNKFDEKQKGASTVSGETAKVTSTIKEDNDYNNVLGIHNDNEVQQSRKPIQIRSYSLKQQNNEEKAHSVAVNKHTKSENCELVVNKHSKYENGMDCKFDYEDINYNNVTDIHDVCEVQQSRKPIRSSSYSLKRHNNEENAFSVSLNKLTEFENCKFVSTKVTDYGNVITIIDMKDISGYSLVIIVGGIISTSPGDIHIFEKDLKKLEAEIGDDTYIVTVTFKEEQVKKFKNQLTYIINIQGTKSLNSDSKIVNALQIANVVESLFQDNSSATIGVTSISCVGEINRFFWCKNCDKKFMPCQDKLQQCTECGMKQLIDDIKDTSISVILSLTEPKLEFTIFQDQLNNIVKIYNEENNTNYKLPTLTDTTLAEIILSVSNVKIYYDKNTKIITDIQKM